MITIPDIEGALKAAQSAIEKLQMEVADLRMDIHNLRDQLKVERNDNKITDCRVVDYATPERPKSWM